MDPASASDNDENLQVLRRLDPELEEVLASAAHVCLYYMHISTQQWTRKNVEGSLFLLKRRKAPRFQMMVLNKLATENYYETIHGSFDFEVNAPYLMYTHGNSEIHGIWFYDQDDLNRLFTLLNRIKSGLPKTDILPTAAPAQTQAPDQPAPGTDTAFWDKQVDVSSGKVPVKPDMQAPAEAAPVQPAAQNLTALLKQAHLKQQQQHAAAPPAQPAQVDAAAPLLTPSFFQSQPSGAAAPQPGPASKQASASKHQEQAGSLGSSTVAATATQPTPDNALHKLFAKAAASPSSLQSVPSQPLASGGQGPVPVAAVLAANAKKQAAPAPPATSAQPQQGDALAKLFSSATSRAAPTVAQGGAAPRPAQGGQVVRDKVRQAMTQLLANDAFVDMISEQFRAVGLLSE